MLINARPRFVFTGFEALVPTQRADFLHPRFVEMTNNEENTWGLFRPAATSTDYWEQSLNDPNSENFPLDPLHSGYYQDPAYIYQPQSTNMPKVSSHNETNEGQSTSYRKSATLQQTYDEPVANMNCFNNPSPMLGSGYSPWGLGRRNGSFAEFSNAQNGPRNYSYQSSNEADTTSLGSSSSLVPPLSPYENLLGANVRDFVKIDKSSPSTVYSSYSSPSISTDTRSMAYPPSNAYDMSIKNTWWSEHSMDNKDQCQGLYGMLASQDGLPRDNTQQQPQGWNDLWHLGGVSTNNWTPAQATPATVSPKALTLNAPPAPMSSSGSSQGRALSLSDSYSGSSSEDDHSDYSGEETYPVAEPPQPIRRPRQLLPSIPGPQRSVPVLPSNGPARSPRKRLLMPNAEDSNVGESAQLRSSPISKVKAASSKATEPTGKDDLIPKRIGPNHTTPSVKQPGTESSQAPQPGGLHRNARDEFLVRAKLAGMAYKDIRRQGNFTEAESTLRGRFRTLTKAKTARVRKPEWCENDLRLLKRAVRKLAPGQDPSKGRVSWKDVAKYIADNGGSYHFGNATCRKRWDKLQMQSES